MLQAVLGVQTYSNRIPYGWSDAPVCLKTPLRPRNVPVMSSVPPLRRALRLAGPRLGCFPFRPAPSDAAAVSLALHGH